MRVHKWHFLDSQQKSLVTVVIFDDQKYMWGDLGYWICLRHLFKSSAVKNLILFFHYYSSELPSILYKFSILLNVVHCVALKQITI